MKRLALFLFLSSPALAGSDPPAIPPGAACARLPNPDAVSRAYCERRERASADAIAYVWPGLSPASARLCAAYQTNAMILECAYRRAVADDQDRIAGGE